MPRRCTFACAPVMIPLSIYFSLGLPLQLFWCFTSRNKTNMPKGAKQATTSLFLAIAHFLHQFSFSTHKHTLARGAVLLNQWWRREKKKKDWQWRLARNFYYKILFSFPGWSINRRTNRWIQRLVANPHEGGRRRGTRLRQAPSQVMLQCGKNDLQHCYRCLSRNRLRPLPRIPLHLDGVVYSNAAIFFSLFSCF